MEAYKKLLQYMKTAPAEDTNVPPLDRIPTNEFIEKFLENDESKPSAPASRRGSSCHGPRQTELDRRSSASASSSGRSKTKTKPTSDKADDLETVLDMTEKFPPFDYTGLQAYERACAKYKSTPCSAVRRKLASASAIDLKHYGSGPRGAMALAIPMVINTKVTSLNLKGNGLDADGALHIYRMMTENTTITELNLAENNLRRGGARIVAEMLRVNPNITRLDISGNGFTDRDAKVLAKAVEDHAYLTTLNLSHNEFGAPSGDVFRTENAVLQELDLSWNQIRARGAVEVANGLEENVGMKVLNLAWNGFGETGAVAIASALEECSLTALDLSCNRINSPGFLKICQAVEGNEDLRLLKLGQNPITEEAAMAALEVFKNTSELSLETLDLSENLYGRRFEEKLAELHEVYPEFTCRHGYTDSYGKRRLKRYNVVEDAMDAMRQYCLEHNINIVELFSRFDADGSMSVTHDEFKLGLKEAKMPLTDFQIEELIKALDQDGDGEIDFSEMVLGAEMYKAGEQ
ncbi:hypothetical protein LSAT2_005806 [Lamellibrachia satsuma]|nr:hypothetical protein LSAT2_005806 [Lamellibrachia satsuma]